MPSVQKTPAQSDSATWPFGAFAPAVNYMVDATQRSILFWDVMRQRGNQYREHLAETAPHVLDYKVEVVLDGRKFDRPVNYALVRVIPPSGVEVDPKRRPFVVVDPRAVTVRALAGSRPIVKSASRSRPDTLAISSGSFRTPCQARPSKILRALKRSSWRK